MKGTKNHTQTLATKYSVLVDALVSALLSHSQQGHSRIKTTGHSIQSSKSHSQQQQAH